MPSAFRINHGWSTRGSVGSLPAASAGDARPALGESGYHGIHTSFGGWSGSPCWGWGFASKTLVQAMLGMPLYRPGVLRWEQGWGAWLGAPWAAPRRAAAWEPGSAPA